MPSCDGAGNCDACYSACEACSVRDIKNMSCMSDAERKMLEARIAELESELIKERKLNRHLTEKIIQMTTK